MRTITGHIVEGDSANHQIGITVLDAPGAGGANHLYSVTGFDTSSNASNQDEPYVACEILFQNGPIKENGVNGLTQETLAAIIIDRLRSFQKGPFACEENQEALANFESGLEILQRRTKRRIARGVEGTTAA